MARADEPGRSRTLVFASLPQCCAVCGGAHVMRLVQLADLRGGGPVACPHCGGGSRPIPIHVYPTRTDRPRGGVA